jgi:hypothetical protein
MTPLANPRADATALQRGKPELMVSDTCNRNIVEWYHYRYTWFDKISGCLIVSLPHRLVCLHTRSVSAIIYDEIRSSEETLSQRLKTSEVYLDNGTFVVRTQLRCFRFPRELALHIARQRI